MLSGTYSGNAVALALGLEGLFPRGAGAFLLEDATRIDSLDKELSLSLSESFGVEDSSESKKYVASA